MSKEVNKNDAELKWKELQYERGDCPRCGYRIIIYSLVAECARCDFKSSWKEYNKRFPTAIQNQIMSGQKKMVKRFKGGDR